MQLLSHIISANTPGYGNRDRIFIRDNSSIKKGDTANSSCWIFSNNHIGTHMDSPFHFCQDGKKTYEIPLEDYEYTNICLIDVPCTEAKLINEDDLKRFDNINADIELLLIRTGYESHRTTDKYWNDNPGLAPELADYLRARFPKLKCVGFDFISLTSWKFRPEGRESHKQFLCSETGKTLLVIEDMLLSTVNNPLSWVLVAPLFVEDGNGGAVTVFAK